MQTMRQLLVRSPVPEEEMPHRRKIMRKTDNDTETFIKFIRENQNDKQTNLRLQKRAPLPGIGQRLSFNDNYEMKFQRSPRIRFGVPSFDENDELDNEINVLNKRKRDPRKDPMLQQLMTLGREQTKDHIILNSLTGTSLQNALVGTCLHSDINSNLLPGNDSRHIGRVSKGQSVKFNKKNNKKLPPLHKEHFPERPSAPSPSTTPTYGDSSDGSYILDDPIDYIDT